MRNSKVLDAAVLGFLVILSLFVGMVLKEATAVEPVVSGDKVIDIEVDGGYLYVLCDDGSMWKKDTYPQAQWQQVTGLPGR